MWSNRILKAWFWSICKLFFYLIFIKFVSWAAILTFLTVIIWIYFISVFIFSLILRSFKFQWRLILNLLLVLKLILWTEIFLFLNRLWAIYEFLQALFWSLHVFQFTRTLHSLLFFIGIILAWDLGVEYFHSFWAFWLYQESILSFVSLNLVFIYQVILRCLILYNVVYLFFA